MTATVMHTPSRESALERLEVFLPNAGTFYGTRRNFDLGPEDRANVSLLSPYLRHRLLLESEVLSATLGRHTLDAADKFVQEIFWRAYFKGWLEHRPSLWQHYRQGVAYEVERLDSDPDLRVSYDIAVHGNTGIDCFDAWVRELVDTGYLHNHARMWFASIWVFTLQLPWELGADFFLRHLMDGDPASNTLSWRWVSGLHTRGKTYLARVSNIASYTNQRFNPERQLAASAPPLEEDFQPSLEPIPAASPEGPDQPFVLLITEEDCSPETLRLAQPPRAALGAAMTADRSPLPIGLPARAFALGAVADALERAAQRFDIDTTQVDADQLAAQLLDLADAHGVSTVVTAYAPVGPVATALARASETLAGAGGRLVQVRREYDEVAWPHAKKGYFKLKGKIPEILDTLAIGPQQERRFDLVVNAG